MAEHLDAWHNQAREELKKCLAHLPDDDPLKCPVSLFGTMDYGRLETAHTRTLAWLLNPAMSKEHGFGLKLLEACLARFTDQPLREVQDVRVEAEYCCTGLGGSELGRLDVMAEGRWEDGTGWLLVIEGKVDAWEGEEQLDRYEEWMDFYARDRQQIRVFLSPDGRPASTGEDEWRPLSFAELAEMLRTAAAGEEKKPGYHFLRYYLAGVLRDICGWPIPITPGCADPYSVLQYLKHVPAEKST